MNRFLKCLLVFLLFLCGCASGTGQTSSVNPDVTVQISAEMLKSLNTDAETYLDSLSQEDRKKFKTAKANDDGSVTLVMSRKTNRQWLKEYADVIREETEKIENSDAYSVQKIAFNSDYTTLRITEKSEQAPVKDVLLVMPLAVYGEMYQLMSGVKEKDIRIHCIVRSASGIQIDDVTYPDDLPAESEESKDGGN